MNAIHVHASTRTGLILLVRMLVLDLGSHCIAVALLPLALE